MKNMRKLEISNKKGKIMKKTKKNNKKWKIWTNKNKCKLQKDFIFRIKSKKKTNIFAQVW